MFVKILMCFFQNNFLINKKNIISIHLKDHFKMIDRYKNHHIGQWCVNGIY